MNNCEHLWKYVGSKRQQGWQCAYCRGWKIPDTTNDFVPNWDAMAVMVEEQQRMAKRIEELEAKLKEKNT